MTDPRTATGRAKDPDRQLTAMIESRHDPDEPTAAALQAEDERRRLDRRARDTRSRNRELWAAHHLHLAEALEVRAEHHRREARALERGR